MRSCDIFLGLGWIGLSCMGGTTSANGRAPAAVGIHQGDTEQIVVASTFGLLVSSDGENFDWVCERNIGYEGTYDPDYAITADGAIFATTFDGVRVSRDGGCTFTEPNFQWVAEVDPRVGPLDWPSGGWSRRPSVGR